MGNGKIQEKLEIDEEDVEIFSEKISSNDDMQRLTESPSWNSFDNYEPSPYNQETENEVSTQDEEVEDILEAQDKGTTIQGRNLGGEDNVLDREGSDEDSEEEKVRKAERKKAEKGKREKTSKREYSVHISRHKVPVSIWKDKQTGNYDRECIRITIKSILLQEIECPCQLRFY